MWHYQFGSKYDTPFWNYAKKLTVRDPDFNIMLNKVKRGDMGGIEEWYGHWNQVSWKNWYDGMNINLT